MELSPQQPTGTKKAWAEPIVTVISVAPSASKNSLGNHEIHNGNGSKITVIGGGTLTSPAVYNSAQSHS
ncbi:MAG TPA: hypothetical protein VIM89_17010 [Mucilaginibacter sp.]